MSERAWLLFEADERLHADRLGRLLAFFGVAATTLPRAGAGTDGGRLMCSARALSALLGQGEHASDESATAWLAGLHSIFVCAAGDPESARTVATALGAGGSISLVDVSPATAWAVTDRLPEVCGAMSGVLVASSTKTAQAALAGIGPDALALVACPAGAAFLRLRWRDVPVFLSTASDVVDLEAPLPPRGFDIRRCLLDAAPPVMYARWAFAQSCWQSPQTCACLVIDDPILRPRYGHLDFQQLLDAAIGHGFAASIAFIPWNWRRGNAAVEGMFQRHPRQLSLSVHGCDHTAGEFGSHDGDWLAAKARQALARMARHQQRTGLACDPVMVFPQGVFSKPAMGALKRSGFIGVVNTETFPVDATPQSVQVAHYWDVAVTNHADLALFTRRYPSDGVENFAFDILLGKPCVVVTHHNDCHSGCRPLVEFIDRLNALDAKLEWCSLGELVRRSHRRRPRGPNAIEVRMYGGELALSGMNEARLHCTVTRRESDSGAVARVRAGAEALPWRASGDGIACDLILEPGSTSLLSIDYVPAGDAAPLRDSLLYALKAALRRHLSELRDNHAARWSGPNSDAAHR